MNKPSDSTVLFDTSFYAPYRDNSPADGCMRYNVVFYGIAISKRAEADGGVSMYIWEVIPNYIKKLCIMKLYLCNAHKLHDGLVLIKSISDILTLL